MRLTEVPDSGAKPTSYMRVEEFKPTAAQLQEYAGTYRSQEIEPVYRIRVQEGKLVLNRLKSKAAELQPALKDVFTTSVGSLRFLRNSAGRVTGVVLNAGRVLNFRFYKAAETANAVY